MTQANHWSRTLGSRMSRRHALALTGVSAFLAACGGGDKSGGPGAKDSSGLLTEPQVSTKDASRGGTWPKISGNAVIYHFDPMDTSNGANRLPIFAYSQPIKFKTGTEKDPPDGSFTGDAAQSWEFSPDQTQLTFKLRPNVKLDQRPPTNGRLLDSADWLYSWNKFVAEAPQSGELSAKRSPGAPVESWSAPDKQTVVLKMAYPYAPLMASLSDSRISFVLVPAEHDGKYDAHNETRGSGPFYLEKYLPSSRIEWRRNPNYWDQPRPYFDGIDEFLITEYAQQLSQLSAGAIWTADVRQEDVIRFKREHMKLVAWLSNFTLTAPRFTGFGWKPDSPFQDIRVRRAFSMLIDRDAMMELNYNLSGFAKEGIEKPTRIHTLISAGDNRFWLDPRSKEIGDGAKNLSFNVGEATNLLKAAGFNREVVYSVPDTLAKDRNLQAATEMLQVPGALRTKINVIEVKEYKATIELYWNGVHDGIADFPGGGATDPDVTMTRYQQNSPFKMFPNPVPFDDLLKKQRQEVDINKRVDLWKEIQRQWAVQVTDITAMTPGLARNMNVAWPQLENYAAIRPWATGTPIEAYTYYWYDKTKV